VGGFLVTCQLCFLLSYRGLRVSVAILIMRVYAGLCGLARFDSETGTAEEGDYEDDDDEDGERVWGGPGYVLPVNP